MEVNILIYTAITIIVTRLWLSLTKISSPYFLGIRLHHYMYGIIISVLGFYLKSDLAMGIGIGLLIDELPLVLRYGNNFLTWEQYDSLYSKIGVVLILFIFSLYYFIL